MTKRPNLLYILSDQHAQRVAGCYGDPAGVTPNLDRLAASGVTFDNAYTTSPICTPARMSALTARHAFRQECWTNFDMLSSEIPTWPHALGAAGYRPTLIGRLHSMGPDQMRGYAERQIGDHSPNWIGIPRHSMGVLHPAHEPGPDSIAKSGPGRSAYELKDVDAARAAVAHLDLLGARRRAGDDRPFAVTLGLMLPHAPFVCRPEDYARFRDAVGLARLRPPPAEREHPWIGWWRGNRGIGAVDRDAELRTRIAYYGLTWRMDALIGEVLDALARNGLADDTLVVYSSDHGEQIGERGLWWKHTFYDQSLKIPLIASWPGRLPAGERRAQLVNLMDLSATVLDALGAPALPNSDGRSFLGVAADGTAPWHDTTFAEYCTDAAPEWTGGMAVQQRMLREGRWKLVYYHGYPPQLFDLADDPDELNDLAAEPRHRALRESLQARLLADWNPDAIAARMRARFADKDVIGAWCRAIQPPSTHVWTLTPDMNRLDLAAE